MASHATRHLRLLALAIVLTAPVSRSLGELDHRRGNADARAEGSQSRAAASYRAYLTSSTTRMELERGAFATVDVALRNRGRRTWDGRAPDPVRLSYHVRDEHGAMLVRDNPRTDLPKLIAPGGTATLRVKIGADRFPAPGEYRLEFDLVREGRTWFADQGSPTLTIPVTVTPVKSVVLDDAELAHPRASALAVADRPEFSALWQLVRNTLAYTHADVAAGTRRYEAFVAGEGYPQVWARDSATVMHATRWFYPAPALRAWIDLLLAHQGADGSVPDWVGRHGVTGTNTVETDQETSLVIGAGDYVRMTGDRAWLATRIHGGAVRDRLHGALEYVWRRRRDPANGLLLGGHTIDWGDVALGRCADDALRLARDSSSTVDVYDQAMMVSAARAIAELDGAAGDRCTAATWRRRAEAIAGATRTLLWQPERGYFRMHRHRNLQPHPFDEDALFPMGGNAVAIQAGIADDEMSERIFTTARRRQTEYAVSTISGVLLPPYPADVYCHPAVREPWHYQNGGQWDWFGARLILAMYEAGHSDDATAALGEIARKDVAHGGLNEWDDRAGDPQGSPWFAGSAGVLARALVEGYFGVDAPHGALVLHPRLKGASGRIALREPATGRRIAYDYRADPDRLRLMLWTNQRAPVTAMLTVPDSWPETSIVTVDGRPVAHEAGKTGIDRWIRVVARARTEPTVVEATPR